LEIEGIDHHEPDDCSVVHLSPYLSGSLFYTAIPVASTVNIDGLFFCLGSNHQSTHSHHSFFCRCGRPNNWKTYYQVRANGSTGNGNEEKAAILTTRSDVDSQHYVCSSNHHSSGGNPEMESHLYVDPALHFNSNYNETIPWVYSLGMFHVCSIRWTALYWYAFTVLSFCVVAWLFENHSGRLFLQSDFLSPLLVFAIGHESVDGHSSLHIE
jgi:hypothetical protein